MRAAPRNTAAAEAARRVTLSQLDGSGRSGKWKAGIFRSLLVACIVIAVATLVAVLLHSLVRGFPRIDLNLVRNMPSSIDLATSGMQSAIFGTIYVMIGVAVTVVPLGVSAALYLEEFADKDKWYVRVIELNIQNLAAVPSIVFGILGLAFIARGPLSLGFVAYAGSLTLSLLVLPTIILTTREAIRAVPSSIRQASMALGATKWRTIWGQVLPSSVPGIATGTILALSRAIGETAPLLLVGATVFVTFNPDGFLEGAFTTLPTQIFSWATRPQDEFRVLAAAGIMVLMAVLLVMNSFAIWIRNRFATEW